MKWLGKVAAQDYIPAQLSLGSRYLYGDGIPKDYIEAAKWLRKAAEQGNSSAQCLLGAVYAGGLGIPQDVVQAYMWFTLSISQAMNRQSPLFKKAADTRGSLAEKMTLQQKAEAEQLTREWENGHAIRLDNGAYLAGKGVTQPVALTRPVPAYTEQARRARVQGIIVVKCVVRKDGTAVIAEIVRGLGYGMDESAINTIEKYWRFTPGTFQGKPVDVMIDIEIVFRMY